MKIRIYAIGKLSPRQPEAQLLTHYQKQIRLHGKRGGVSDCEIICMSHPTISDLAKRQKIEAAFLLQNPLAGEVFILLDERGIDVNSQQFSALLGGYLEQNIPALRFLLGGNEGVAEIVRQKVHKSICMGRLIWPYALARVMLCEQIYRGLTILSGHPYSR